MYLRYSGEGIPKINILQCYANIAVLMAFPNQLNAGTVGLWDWGGKRLTFPIQLSNYSNSERLNQETFVKAYCGVIRLSPQVSRNQWA